jgi:hypothetical protein
MMLVLGSVIGALVFFAGYHVGRLDGRAEAVAYAYEKRLQAAQARLRAIVAQGSHLRLVKSDDDRS